MQLVHHHAWKLALFCRHHNVQYLDIISNTNEAEDDYSAVRRYAENEKRVPASPRPSRWDFVSFQNNGLRS